MSDDQPRDRSEGAYELAGAVRRAARTARSGQARTVRLLVDNYGWGVERVAEALEVAPATIDRVLAVDGRPRCVDCSFGLHRSCIRRDESDRPCLCECHAR